MLLLVLRQFFPICDCVINMAVYTDSTFNQIVSQNVSAAGVAFTSVITMVSERACMLCEGMCCVLLAIFSMFVLLAAGVFHYHSNFSNTLDFMMMVELTFF